MTFRLVGGDAIEAMQAMAENSVDAIVTDPPYGLEFMGKEWDKLTTEPLIRRSGHEDANSGAGMTQANGIYPKARNQTGVKFGGQTWTSECAVCGGRDMMRKGCKCETPTWNRVLVNGNAQFRAMQEWHHAWATEALRILKPGGHLLAFGGTRTYHRLACAIEDAGFEIRDCIAWMYGSGFPKSLDVSKAIDKAAGAEREVLSVDTRTAPSFQLATEKAHGYLGQSTEGRRITTAPATPEAQRWNGWGTALKPAFEPIVLARKPLSERNVAANVTRWGTGALNIDGCRIDTEGGTTLGRTNHRTSKFVDSANGTREAHDRTIHVDNSGGARWPANVTLDETAAAMLDEQTGELTGGGFPAVRSPDAGRTAYGEFAGQAGLTATRNESGGASRFFYCPKADREERNRGLEHMAQAHSPDDGYGSIQTPILDRATPRENWQPHKAANHHPTVKPVELMRWLCRMVTPKGGTVLDPFTGSGSTGVAAMREGFEFIGIEREAEYVEIARARIIGDAPLFNLEAVGGGSTE